MGLFKAGASVPTPCSKRTNFETKAENTFPPTSSQISAVPLTALHAMRKPRKTMQSAGTAILKGGSVKCC